MKGWLYLAAAIVVEVLSTSLLSSTGGFTHLLPTVAVLAGYGASFYFLSKAVRTVALSTAYALWSAIGTAVVATIGVIVLGETLSVAKVLGLGLVIAGVVNLNAASATAVCSTRSHEVIRIGSGADDGRTRTAADPT